MNSLGLQLNSLVRCLTAQKIDYVVLGGVALALYGEPRMTVDIDVNVIIDKRRVSDFLTKVKKFGFYPAFINAKRTGQRHGVIPLLFKKGSTSGLFDIIIAENPLEYAAIRRGRLKKIGPVKARFISPEDLIIHKLTSPRARDFEDLKGILLRQRGKLDLTYIRGWLKKIDEVNKTETRSQFNNLLKSLRRLI